MKQFTNDDIQNPDSNLPSIYADKEDLIYSPLEWHILGLQQTSSGYGKKLTTPHKISFNGKLYRIYATCFSNCASHWFVANGEKIWIS